MMICTHCGKVLKDYDKFCSNCGAIIEREESREFMFTAPERDFEWNIHSFPDAVHHKTEEAVFDWGIPEGEFKRRPRENDDQILKEPTISPVPGSVPEQESEGNDDIAVGTNDENVIPKESPEKRIKEKKSFFARFQRDRDVTIEQPVITDEQIVKALNEKELNEQQSDNEQHSDNDRLQYRDQIPYEQMQQDDLQGFNPEHIEFDWTQKLDPRQEFLAMQEKTGSTSADEMIGDGSDEIVSGVQNKTPEIVSFENVSLEEELFGSDLFENERSDDSEPHANELREEHEDDIKGEQLERELFGGAAVTGVVGGGEALSVHSAQIDKFYTLNKKNEEFQKLLDKEYERFNEGRPLDKDTFSANVEAIRANVEKQDIFEMDKVGGIEHMQELNDTIRVNGVDDAIDNRKTMPYQIIDDDISTVAEKVLEEDGFRKVDEPQPKEWMQQSEQPQMQFRQSFADSGNMMAGMTGAAAGKSDEIMTEASKSNITEASANSIPEGIGESNEEKSGKAGKIVIIVLSIILALLLLALGFKLIAPDSIISQRIDNVADSVMNFFTGDEQTPQSVIIEKFISRI